MLYLYRDSCGAGQRCSDGVERPVAGSCLEPSPLNGHEVRYDPDCCLLPGLHGSGGRQFHAADDGVLGRQLRWGSAAQFGLRTDALCDDDRLPPACNANWRPRSTLLGAVQHDGGHGGCADPGEVQSRFRERVDHREVERQGCGDQAGGSFDPCFALRCFGCSFPVCGSTDGVGCLDAARPGLLRGVTEGTKEIVLPILAS
mmetsp:Transcript_63307/g.131008  ORF Transcript_63307/g.131008 Transcript_63307/m.131008 type:complete len:201 (-) Transcript_63307:8-610(-)